MKRLLLLLAALALPSTAYAQFPSQNITLPAFVIPASAVTGGGGFPSQLLAPAADNCTAPPYSFTGNTNTGVCSPAANSVGMQIGGTFTHRFGTIAYGLESNSAEIRLGAGADTVLAREAADHSFWKRTTNAQRASWANTYASTISYEAFSIDWQTVANSATVGTRTAATGTGRSLKLVAQADSGAANYLSLVFNPQVVTPMSLGYYNASGTVLTNNAFTTLFTVGEILNTATSGTFVNTKIAPQYNQASGTAANSDLSIARTETAVGSGAQYFINLLGGASATTQRAAIDSTGKFAVYGSVAVAGQGLEAIRAQATTGTVTNSGTASIATWTPGAADVEVEVGCRVNITVSTTHSFSCDVTYTDVANNARTRVLPMNPISGTPLATGLMTNTVGAGDFGSSVIRIGVKASTAITVRTSSGGTFTTVTYTASGTIKQVG